METVIDNIIQETFINDILNMYRESVRNVRNPNRNFHIISSRYYNDPPRGGYQIDEEHDYILPDNDDISSMIFLDVVTRFGSPGSDSLLLKDDRRDKIKKIGKYKKVKKTDLILLELTCPICIENFKEGEYYRNLDCNHSFHKKCIDHWFKKDHSECPMCRKIIII
jgi:hypothetical protein